MLRKEFKGNASFLVGPVIFCALNWKFANFGDRDRLTCAHCTMVKDMIFLILLKNFKAMYALVTFVTFVYLIAFSSSSHFYLRFRKEAYENIFPADFHHFAPYSRTTGHNIYKISLNGKCIVRHLQTLI